MAELTEGVSGFLNDILLADDIVPGASPSYQLCKLIYLFHPLGAKIVDAPIKMAQSKPRKISIPDSPEDIVKEAFLTEWKRIKADELIYATMSNARMYGISSIFMGVKGQPLDSDINLFDIPQREIYFNVYDPLNNAGSLVLDQNPNAEDFQKPYQLTAAGRPLDMSRACIIFNERPIYLAFTSSAFGFVGRSVYQRPLFPLKSFIRTMVADDMVALKAGVIVAKMQPAGSIVDNIMRKASELKRSLLREAQTTNVISIGQNDEISAIDLTNVHDALERARDNIVVNIATACDMPSIILKNETLTQGFGEGSEDAKVVMSYIDGIRENMQPLYEFFDRIVQVKAWTPEFYASVQAKFPDEYGIVSYEVAFQQWRNSFHAEWPKLLEDPEDKKVKVEDVKYQAMLKAVELLIGQVDPENKARIVEWMADNMNENKAMFSNPLELDYQALAEFVPVVPETGEESGEE